MYFLLVIYLLVCSFSSNRTLTLCSFILISFSLAISFGSGYDWINYRQIYYELQTYDAGYLPFEPGYYFLFLIFNKLGFSFYVVHVFTVLITLWLVYRFCLNTYEPNLSFFVIFSFMGFFLFMEQVRQGIAVSIAMNAVICLRNGSKRKFLLYLFFSLMFHLSSLVCLLNLFFLKKKSSGSFIYILVSSLGLIFMLYIFNNPSILSIGGPIANKIFLYGLMSNSLANSLLIKSSVVYIAIILLAIFMRKDFNGFIFNGRIKKASLFSSVFIYQTKAAFFLQRLQYYMVPTLVIGFDYAMAFRKKLGLHRLTYIFLVFLISLMPLRFDIYKRSLITQQTIFMSKRELSDLIKLRCNDLLSDSEDNFIIKECNK